MEKEFDPMSRDLANMGATLNPTAVNEHVPEIKRSNCIIKEWVRSVRCTLPYNCMPLIMLEELVNFCIMWLNAFPPRGGVSKTFCPKTIMTGMVLNIEKHCRIPFGAYAQTHEEGSNNMKEQMLGAISLGPIGNVQGSYKFMNLRTRKQIVRHDFDEVPAP
eukprot:6947964-Ditylum_brightwellii.AAC.1